jgi:hypothetical protein
VLLPGEGSDGVPEIVADGGMVTNDEGKPPKVVAEAGGVLVIPIAPGRPPLLSVVFDSRPYGAEPTWRWRLLKNNAGTQDVVVEQSTKNRWAERARFAWSAKKSRYEGPSGSKAEGFIASPGAIDTKVVLDFMKTITDK